MGHLILVRAAWDQEANVWVAESTDLAGLVTEAASLDELNLKLPGLIQDLMEDGGDIEEMDIPVEVVASFSSRIKIRPKAA